MSRCRLLLPCVLAVLAACSHTPPEPLPDPYRSPLASWVPSDNFESRRPVLIVLHATEQESVRHSLDTLRDRNSSGRVSAHYLIGDDGHIFQLVADDQRAWHAGKSCWDGLEDLNSWSVGIEIVNPGHNHGLRPFPAVQIDRLIELCRDCVAKWAIPAANVVGHSDIAPSRKEDPGELFPWDQLSAAGIGMTVEPVPISGGRFPSPGDKGDPVAAWQAMLAAYGFDVTADGNYGDTTRLATLAFQRHHRPSLLDGIADTSTVGTMHRLLSRRISEEQGRHLAP